MRSNTESSGSEERREHWQEVHRQRVRLMESDDHRSQSLDSQLSSVMQLDSREALCTEYHVTSIWTCT